MISFDDSVLRSTYFSTNPLSCNWYNIANPAIIANLKPIILVNPREILADKQDIKAAFKMAGKDYFIRFTVRKIGLDSSVHGSTVSEVAIYSKTEGTPADSHLENPEDGHRMPFIDDKISYYLASCQGGIEKS